MDTVTVRPTIGDKIRAKVYVSAPQGPVEPGGFDFRQHAYFLSLGAVGYGRSGFDIVHSNKPIGTEMFFSRAQGWLSQLVQSALSEQTQGVARAIIAGDRFGVSQAQAEDLRRSNLAHLLAISGLHMGLLTSLVFFSVRFTLVIMPMRAIANHAKTIAAIFAITVGALYLGISGGNIATQRAFVMIAAFYSAAMLNRQVISYRALAMAAMVILIARPEALYSPGFQMSFAATIALVFVFQNVVAPRSSGRILHATIGVFLSSFVAGVATAPIAAIHFNQISHVGFFANLLAVPVMSAVVAPSAVLGILLSPVGLEWIGFWGVEIGLRWILGVAAYASKLSYALSYTVTPLGWGLPSLTFGALLVVLWRGRGGIIVGCFVLIVGFSAWPLANRADILISRDGRLVGVLTPIGRALSKKKGDTFTADIWMENDGMRIDREVAFNLWKDNVHDIRHFWSKRDNGRSVICAKDDIIVTIVDLNVTGPCTIITSETLEHFGSMALWRDQNGAIKKSENDASHRARYAWRQTTPPFAFTGDQ